MSRSLSSGLKANYASPDGTRATCLKVILTNTTVLGFTSFNRDLVVSGVTYYAADGYSLKDIATSGALNVDSAEVAGPTVYPNVTEADLLAGIWDYAYFELFEVNYADLTQGRMILRAGHIGQVSVARNQFTTELRGLTEAYARTIGRIDAPQCPWNLGDANCTVSLGPFTKTGSITSLNPDNVTFYDTAQTEPGPSGAVAITAVSQANPGVVTITNNYLGFINGQVVTIFGATGMTAINGNVTVAGLAQGTPPAFTFQLPVDTNGYPAYTGSGQVTPLGGTSGYFQGGLVTFTSGLNNGLSMEIRSYTTGQFTLQLPMPYAMQVGDTYSAVAGCDKTFPTCRDRFANQLNFGGEPYFPGQDQLIQVGRHST